MLYSETVVDYWFCLWCCDGYLEHVERLTGKVSLVQIAGYAERSRLIENVRRARMWPEVQASGYRFQIVRVEQDEDGHCTTVMGKDGSDVE